LDLAQADIDLVKEESSSQKKPKKTGSEENDVVYSREAAGHVQKEEKKEEKLLEEEPGQEKKEKNDDYENEDKNLETDEELKKDNALENQEKDDDKSIETKAEKDEKQEKKPADIFEFANGLPKHLDDRRVKQALAKEGYSAKEIDEYFGRKEDVNAFDVIESDNAMKTIYMLNFVLLFIVTIAFLFTNRPLLHYYVVIPSIGILLSLLMIYLNRKFLGKPNYITLYGAYLPVYGLFTIYLPIAVVDFFRDGIGTVLESLQGIMPIQLVLGKSFNPMFLMLIYLVLFNLPIIIIALSKKCFNRKDLMHYSIAIFLYIIGMLGISWFLTFFS
jgi:hypothetical protein